MKDWILYNDDWGHELLCRRTRRDPYWTGSPDMWEYEVAASRHTESTRWVRPARPDFRTLDPSSPEFRSPTKEHVMAILLRAEKGKP